MSLDFEPDFDPSSFLQSPSRAAAKIQSVSPPRSICSTSPPRSIGSTSPPRSIGSLSPPRSIATLSPPRSITSSSTPLPITRPYSPRSIPSFSLSPPKHTGLCDDETSSHTPNSTHHSPKSIQSTSSIPATLTVPPKAPVDELISLVPPPLKKHRSDHDGEVSTPLELSFDSTMERTFTHDGIMHTIRFPTCMDPGIAWSRTVGAKLELATRIARFHVHFGAPNALQRRALERPSSFLSQWSSMRPSIVNDDSIMYFEDEQKR